MEPGSLDHALARRRSIRSFGADAVPRRALDRVLWAAQGRTDDHGNRTAPSAHGIHPLRLAVAAGRIDGLEPALYAVEPGTGTLAAAVDGDAREALEGAAFDEQPWIGEAAGIVSISADLEAMTRAFAHQAPAGVRGTRYAHMEAGAAAQNMLLELASLGLGGVLVAGFDDGATAGILGLAPGVEPVAHVCFGVPLA